MTVHEEYGLSESLSTGLGQANVLVTASGLSESVATGLGQANVSVVAHGLSEAVSIGLGSCSIGPGIASVVAVNSTKVRITFDNQMTDDVALIDLDNYTITPTGFGVPVYKISMEAEGVTYPNYVDITISEMTDGQIYQAEIETAADGPIDRYGDNIDVSKSTETFTGVGEKPEIKYVEALSETSAKVVFTEAMEDNTKIRDETNYSFDNGLTISEITSVSGDSVFFKTSEQTPGLLYTLTITS